MPLLILGGAQGFVVYLTNKGLDQQASAAPQDERHWRAGGLFYYNPDDAALFVDKRYGLGWTMNIARPMSWAILIGIPAVPLLIVLLTVLLSR